MSNAIGTSPIAIRWDEHAALWIAGITTLLVWFALGVDLENALVWEIKNPGGLGGSTRFSKTVICLCWCVLVTAGIAWRFKLGLARVLAVFVVALAALIAGSMLKSNQFVVLNLMQLVGKSYTLMAWGILGLCVLMLQVAIPATFAYRFLARDACARRHVALAIAITLVGCGLILWTGLLYVLHPGFAWR